MNVGKAIKEIRIKKKLTQLELAKATGITQAAMSGIENGNIPNPSTLKKIVAVLNVPESLIYAIGIEPEDVAENKRELYKSLYPVIKKLVMEIAQKE